MKNCVALNVVYCICVNSAVLRILPYVFELLPLILLINCVKYFGCENWWLMSVQERRQKSEGPEEDTLA
jgi:hypothetical protein